MKSCKQYSFNVHEKLMMKFINCVVIRTFFVTNWAWVECIKYVNHQTRRVGSYDTSPKHSNGRQNMSHSCKGLPRQGTTQAWNFQDHWLKLWCIFYHTSIYHTQAIEHIIRWMCYHQYHFSPAIKLPVCCYHQWLEISYSAFWFLD